MRTTGSQALLDLAPGLLAEFHRAK